jgi:hypothetical protein
MRWFYVVLLAAQPLLAQEDLGRQILQIKRVYVDKLTGGASADQIRELIIGSLQSTKLFVITENPDRADAFLRGAAEDLIYTDQFSSENSLHARATLGSAGSASARSDDTGWARGRGIAVGEQESTNIRERKHEALATIRLVNKDGDVLWSTTQESNGAKFRGASADVADKITKALSLEYQRLRGPAPAGAGRP